MKTKLLPILLLLAVGHNTGPTDPVWKPGRNCVMVWKLCDWMTEHRMFVNMMTGPGGTLGVKSHGGRPSTFVIDPNDLLYQADMDFDRDVDLYDFALRERVKK